MRSMPYKAKQDRVEGLKHIAKLAATVKACWAKACEADSIPVDSTFVIFSAGNKVAPFYERAMTQYMEATQQYAAGGYVGVTLSV